MINYMFSSLLEFSIYTWVVLAFSFYMQKYVSFCIFFHIKPALIRQKAINEVI